MYASKFLQLPTEVLCYVDQFFLLLANKHYPQSYSCVCVPWFNLMCKSYLSLSITVFLPYWSVCLVKLFSLSPYLTVCPYLSISLYQTVTVSQDRVPRPFPSPIFKDWIPCESENFKPLLSKEPCFDVYRRCWPAPLKLCASKLCPYAFHCS